MSPCGFPVPVTSAQALCWMIPATRAGATRTWASAARVGLLHLCLETAAAGVHEHDETGIAQALGQAQRLRSGPVTGIDDICVHWASRGDRSEERRVGKECRSRWSPYH